MFDKWFFHAVDDLLRTAVVLEPDGTFSVIQELNKSSLSAMRDVRAFPLSANDANGAPL